MITAREKIITECYCSDCDISWTVHKADKSLVICPSCELAVHDYQPLPYHKPEVKFVPNKLAPHEDTIRRYRTIGLNCTAISKLLHSDHDFTVSPPTISKFCCDLGI